MAGSSSLAGAGCKVTNKTAAALNVKRARPPVDARPQLRPVTMFPDPCARPPCPVSRASRSHFFERHLAPIPPILSMADASSFKTVGRRALRELAPLADIGLTALRS